MMDRSNYAQQAAQQAQLQQQLQLYQELKYRFPGASQAIVLETMQRNRNHREQCLDELTLFTMAMSGGGGGGGTVGNSVYAHQPPSLQLSSQQAYGNQQMRMVPGTRSRSVSGVPGADGGAPRPYGFRYVGDDRVGCPQTAPVMPSYGGQNGGSPSSSSSSFMPIYHFRPPPMQHSASCGSVLPPQKPPKPPVPPPTYRVIRGSEQEPDIRSFPNNIITSQSPSVNHKTSVNFAPVYPNMRGPYEDWGVPGVVHQQQHLHGWNQPQPTPGISSHQLLQITTPGHGGGQQQQQQMQNQQPYHQSRLHISISPNGNSISPVTPPPRRPSAGSNNNNNATTPPVGHPVLQFRRREGSFVAGDLTPPPRVSPSEASHIIAECPFDVDDPEQENLSHRPLRPLPSPTPGVQKSASGTSSSSSSSTTSSSSSAPLWPNVLSVHQPSRDPTAVYDDQAFTQALIVHQKDRLGLLRRELSREVQRLQELFGDVTLMENHLFCRRTQFHDQVFPTFDDMQRLWSEIRAYSVDCQCMSLVVDHLHRGQVPLGETNEDFYKSINTGQQGQVLPPTPITRQGLSPSMVGGDNCIHGIVSPIPQMTISNVDSNDNRICEHVVSNHVNDDNDDEERDKWSCSACTFLNNHALERCEMCEMPRVVLGGMHNLRIQLRQNPHCAAASNSNVISNNNKGLQLKLTHKLGLVRR